MFERRKLRPQGFLTTTIGGFTIPVILAAASFIAAAPFPAPSSPRLARHIPRILPRHKDLPNYAEVTTTLYRGGQPSTAGFRALAKKGINIVVDLRGSRDSERRTVNHLGMQYVPMPWKCSFPKDKVFAQFLRLLRDNPGKKIFVHCRLGDDRTGMMIASYRMAREGWSAERAEKEMEKFGFNFAHKRLICPRLSSYEEKFPQRFKTSPAFRGVR